MRTRRRDGTEHCLREKRRLPFFELGLDRVPVGSFAEPKLGRNRLKKGECFPGAIFGSPYRHACALLLIERGANPVWRNVDVQRLSAADLGAVDAALDLFDLAGPGVPKGVATRLPQERPLSLNVRADVPSEALVSHRMQKPLKIGQRA